MADPRLLEQRKRLLVAQSSLHRIRMQHEMLALRRSMTAGNMLSAARTSPGRSLAIGALMLVAGRHRVARFVRTAMAVVAIAKAVRAAFALARRER